MPTINRQLDPTGVLILAIAAFVLPILFFEFRVLGFTSGTLAYPIDDTFIHLAIAKNLAFHGVWGITAGEFTSAASSLLYPVLLALIVKIAGAHIIIPLLVNIAAGIVLLIVLRRWLENQQVGPWGQLWILLAVIFFTPLPIIAMSGMEHILQFLFTFLFVARFSRELAEGLQSGEKGWEFSWRVYVFAALTTATRYEGLTILGIACLALLIHRRVWLMCRLAMLGALPVLLFGFYSLYHNSYFIPNSVLLKSGAPPLTVEGITYFLTNGVFTKLFFPAVGYNSVATQHLLLLLPACFLAFSRQIREQVMYRYMLLIYCAVVFLHLLLTGHAHFPRYEAYLIGCGVTLAGTLVAKYGKSLFVGASELTRWVAGLLTIFIVFPMWLRSTNVFGEVDQACVNIYEQQFQMGQFLHQYYYNDRVAIYDIGAVSYYTMGKKMDLVGLGDIEVARSRKGHYDSPDFLDWLSRKDSIKLAIIFDYWTDPSLSKRWSKVANWKIPNNVACGEDNVSFYAVDKDAAPELKKDLQEFQKKSLPKDVEVRYY